MNSKAYSLSVAKMIAGSKSKKGVPHIAVAVAGTDQFIVVNEAEFLASLTKIEEPKASKPAAKKAKKFDPLVTATLPLHSVDLSSNSHWVGAVNPEGGICWFLKSVSKVDLEAKTVTVTVPESKTRSAVRKSIQWKQVI